MSDLHVRGSGSLSLGPSSLDAKYEEAVQQVAALTQAMWDARAILGFDNDGDKTPAAAIAGAGSIERFIEWFLRDMREERADADETSQVAGDAMDALTRVEALIHRRNIWVRTRDVSAALQGEAS